MFLEHILGVNIMSIKKKIFIFISLCISVIIVFTSCLIIRLSELNVTVEYRSDCIVFPNTPYDTHVYYDQITSIDIVDTKYGNEYVSLEQKYSNWEIGLYKNDTWGRYNSIVSRASKKSIVTYLNGDCYYVIGLKDLDETLNILQHIIDNTSVGILNKKGVKI